MLPVKGKYSENGELELALQQTTAKRCDCCDVPAEKEDVFTNKDKVQKEVKAVLTQNATLSCEVAQEKTHQDACHR